jgi:ketosteroid isomerase-like protein
VGAAENKQAVKRWLAAMQAGDPALPELLTDDATWWVPPSSPLGGTYRGKAEVLKLMGQGIGLYDASVPMRIEIQRMVAEDDAVCVQLVLRGRTARGEDYENHYHFAFELRGGKICAVKEYVDTLYAQRKLFGEAQLR